jgi:hypothetical protein
MSNLGKRTVSTQVGEGRRHFVAKVAGLAGAAVAGAQMSGSAASAADGEPVTVGEANTGTSATTLRRESVGTCFEAIASFDGEPIGAPEATAAVIGTNAICTGYGVIGRSLCNEPHSGGVLGTTDATHGHGVHGVARSTLGNNVGGFFYSRSIEGVGVLASNDSGGTGLRAGSKGGRAIEAVGPVALATLGRLQLGFVSGQLTIRAGRTEVTHSPRVDVTPQSFVLLTPMGNLAGRSLWFRRNVADNQFTIHMSAPRRVDTVVGWLLLDATMPIPG